MAKISLWLLLFFILLFLWGANNGELATIMNTGSTICLSCIGVG